MPALAWWALSALLASGATLAQTEGLVQLPDDPPADRSLAAPEAIRLADLAVTLLDKEHRVGRPEAADQLGQKMHHLACIPPLRFVALDESDDAFVRVHAMIALLRIGRSDSLGDLLPNLRSKDPRVRGSAHALLVRQHAEGRAFGYDPQKPPEENADALTKWEQWWERNKETFRLNIWDLMEYH